MDTPRRHQWRTDESSARRFAEAIATQQTIIGVAGILHGHHMVVQLADGVCTGPYESREAAWEASTNLPSRIFIFPLTLERLPAEAADVLLWYVRRCYDNGWREDPRFALWMPNKNEDLRRVL